MRIDINLWAVVLAAVSSMVVGSMWYMPHVFGKTWSKLTGVKLSTMDAGKPRQMIWTYGSVFVASLVTAYILAAITFLAQQFFHDSYLYDALTMALWLWFGFTAARMYVHDTFEGRRKKLTILNTTHELVTVLVMALILGWLHP
jgi:hypothetical protein